MRAVAIFLFLTGCTTADRTTRETILARYENSPDTLAVLIISPAECFACNNAIGDLMRWVWEAPNRSLITLLTRQPSRTERTQMAIMRIRIMGVIRDAPGRATEPQVVMLSRGVTLDSARGQKAILAIANKYNHVER
jgi:hypothetical protein